MDSQPLTEIEAAPSHYQNSIVQISDNENVNNVIDIADDSSDENDVVVNLLNSSDEMPSVSNISIYSSLDSIRSDHNSSQELFAEATDRAAEVSATDFQPIDEPIDHVNEMQALIASWMHNSSMDSRATILNNVEDEIKRIKKIMLVSEQSEDPPPPNVRDNAIQAEPSTSAVTDNNEDDNILSEGYSEPVECRTGRSVLRDEETAQSFRDLRSVTEKIASEMSEFSKLFSVDPFPEFTAKVKLLALTECGGYFVKYIKAMATTLKIEIVRVDENIRNPTDSTTSENDRYTEEKLESETGGIEEDRIDDKTHSTAGNEANDDEIVDKVDETVEDKQKQLDLRSKKRWLALEDSQLSSEDSYSESVNVKRRKKRARTASTSGKTSSTKKIVLLGSTNDEKPENGASSSTALDDVQYLERLDLTDVDMSSYPIPSERVDSDEEEFFGFDVIDPFCDAIEPDCDAIDPSSDVIEPASDVMEPAGDMNVSAFDAIEVFDRDSHCAKPACETEESVESKMPFVESQQCELPESIETSEGNISAKEEFNTENNVECDAERVIENEDPKADDEKDNESDVCEYDTDAEIDRLVDFSNILTKVRPTVDSIPVCKKRAISKPKPKEDRPDLVKDFLSEDIESKWSSEEQFVLQLSKQLDLKDFSESADEDSDSVKDDEGQSSIDYVSDESNDSKLNTFIKKRLAHEIENHLDCEETALDNTPKESPVDANDVDKEKCEQDLELRSSGIFVPEVELPDGGRLPDKDKDSDAEETIDQQQKSSEKKNKWKLDKNAFSKNLFSNMDDLDDCEMLDLSMFKASKGAGDLDQIIQNQEKRDVSSKISTKVGYEYISMSSDSDLEIDKDDDSEGGKPTTKSRPMLRNDQLAGETKQAQKEENDRLQRLEIKTERLTQIVESQTEKLTQSNDDSDVILDFDTKQNCAISVHPEIVKNLKEHQIAGVKFMYDCCYGSVDSIEKHNGSGCILAHCMGLGKTLQLIALMHTLIRYPQMKTRKILVICPKSTIMNWADEIQTWLRSVKVKLKVLHFPDQSDIYKKIQILHEWHSLQADPEGRAGCMLIGYEAFRSLVFYADKPKPDMLPIDLDRIRSLVEEYLLKPGADLVVCDEGHIIKNRKSTTSRAVNKISSRRRIILTGTPIQNNLKEYYSMVNFVKPSILGTEKEFANLYENPINEGQHKDSNSAQIRIMKQRSYVLHRKLSKFVQRREAALLKTFLPEKYEYVLFIPMTELQNRLYQHFLDNNPLKESCSGIRLISDYTFLRKIWTHPKVLENAWRNAVALRDKKIAARRRNMGSDEEPDDVLDNQMGRMSVENDWWLQFMEPQDLRSLLSSNKLRILFEILRLCEQNREKCLIFSAFVAVLDVVEYFMHQIHNKVSFGDGSDLGIENFHGPWQKNVDYYRLDGKTSKALRHAMIQNFNNLANQRVKCFLISARAGGLGINLVGANRVILLDTSWNPSNDQQNIFRVFRLGQQSKCYIYRLLAMGTMEEKVYSRSVTKQAMSFRVVDEQQIDRHYSLAELAELYTFTKPDPNQQPTPIRPVDNILANLLRNFNSLVYKYHEHDSLLENNSAEDLNEQEKADAWEAYEKDVSMKNQFENTNPNSYIPQNLPTSMIPAYLQRMGYTAGVRSTTGVEPSPSTSTTTSSPTSYSNILPPVWNEISQLTSSPSVAAGASQYNMAWYMPPSSSIPFSMYPTSPSVMSTYSAQPFATNQPVPNTIENPLLSNMFSRSTSVINATSPSVAASHYNMPWYMSSYTGNRSSSIPFSMYPTSPSVTSTYSAQPFATNQPGPNAISNPLLSHLLPQSTSVISTASPSVAASQYHMPWYMPSYTDNPSSSIPFSMYPNSTQPLATNQPGPNAIETPHHLLPPSTSVAKDNSFSMTTSVITEAPKDFQRFAATYASLRPISWWSSTSTSNSHQPLIENQLTLARDLSSARSSPLSSPRASPLSSAMVSPVSSASSTIAATSSTLVDASSSATGTDPSETSAQSFQNLKKIVVYPKAPKKRALEASDLSQNDSLLKAAKNQ